VASCTERRELRNSASTGAAFYAALGYTVDDVVSLGKRIDC